MNNKGEMRVGTIIIGIAVFLVFLTAGLLVTDEFMAVPEYGTDFNTSYYGGLQSNRVDTGTETSDDLRTLIFGTNDIMMESNNSVGTATTEETMNRKSLESIINLKSSYVLIKNLGRDLNDKMGIPTMFIDLLIFIVVITITIASISALRGIGKL
jgi:hypothetical protein